MSGAAFLRIKKLKGSGIVTVAARHNRRVIQAEMGAAGSIDAARSHLNETLTGPATAEDVGQLAKELMAAAGVTKVRKDAVMALEIVFSLPAGHVTDDRAYFTDCADWIARFLGGVILSVDVHRDEAAPHCHVILLPLVNGRMGGSDMLGGKQMLMTLQKQFHLDVASKHGLSKAPARLSGTSKQEAAKAVLEALRQARDPALKSKLWPALREVIENEPERFLMPLGIELKTPSKKLRTVAQVFTSKGKGGAKEKSPIGFASSEKRQTLCSVGFASKTPPKTASKVPDVVEQPVTSEPVQVAQAESVFAEATRIRDADLDPDCFHDGDYCPRPSPTPRRHQYAVEAALSQLALQHRARAPMARQPSPN